MDLVAGSELGDEGSTAGEGGGEDGVMVNDVCQMAWGTRCSAIWSDIFLSVSMRVFLDEINSDLQTEQSRLPSPTWGGGLIPSTEDLNTTKRPSEREFFGPPS